MRLTRIFCRLARNGEILPRCWTAKWGRTEVFKTISESPRHCPRGEWASFRYSSTKQFVRGKKVAKIVLIIYFMLTLKVAAINNVWQDGKHWPPQCISTVVWKCRLLYEGRYIYYARNSSKAIKKIGSNVKKTDYFFFPFGWQALYYGTFSVSNFLSVGTRTVSE